MEYAPDPNAIPGLADKYCVEPLNNKLPAILAKGCTDDDAADDPEFPAPFVATTVNVYDVPFVSPVTTAGEVVDVAVKLPGDDVTV